MSQLAQLLSSRVREEMFRLLFGPSEEIHLRELARRSGITPSAVRQELARLTELDLVRARRSGNRVYFQANREHPLYPEIRLLVAKTVGLADGLREALAQDGVRCAFIFGSVATGKEKAGSDVDLMVVGDVTLKGLSARLAGIEEKVGREVNPFVLTVKEFREKFNKRDHFLVQVLNSPKIFLVGSENDLAAMGR